MNHLCHAALVPSLFVLVTLISGPARPCSQTPPSLHGAISPADGATAVPLNGRIVITTFVPPDSFEARLFAPDDEEGVSLPARVQPHHVVFELTDAVLPNTEYLVVFTTFDPDSEFMDEREPLSFTTGDAIDDEAPLLISEPVVESEYRPASPLGALDSCGGGESQSWSVTVTPPDASDDVEVAGYRLLRVEGDSSVELMVTLRYEGAQLYDSRGEGGSQRYVVEAFDLAGNTVRSSDVEIALVPFVGGCSATGVGDGRAPVFALALLGTLALALGRRRRQR